jgi:hypothetical protein
MSTDLVTLSTSLYPILAPTNDRLAIIQQNLDGESLTAADLTRIRIPRGDFDTIPDKPKWVIDTADGEKEMESFRCVVIHTQCRRAYYKSAKPVEGTPPDCFSSDCKQGVGDPGGDCGTCPLAAWKSAQGGTGAGQACRKSRVFVVVREGEYLPEWFSAPPTSLKDMRNYLSLLGKAGLYPLCVVTEFSLKKGKASVLVAAKRVGTLDEAAYQQIVKIKNDFSGTADSFNREITVEAEPEEV